MAAGTDSPAVCIVVLYVTDLANGLGAVVKQGKGSSDDFSEGVGSVLDEVTYWERSSARGAEGEAVRQFQEILVPLKQVRLGASPF
jgi:hypothetical protein